MARGEANSPDTVFAFHLTAARELGTIPPRTQANTNTPATGNKEKSQ
jgi:hypothetical protein